MFSLFKFQDQNVETGILGHSKRAATINLKDAIGKINLSLEKSLESPLLGSIRNTGLLKSKAPSLLDSYKSPFGTRIGLTSLLNPRETSKSGISPAPSPSTKVLSSSSTSVRPITSSNVQKPTAKRLDIQIIPEDAVGTSKPIVLPDYLLKKHKKPPKPKPGSDKITETQLKETAELRKEIQYAVNHHLYKHSSSEFKNINYKYEEEGDYPEVAPPPPPSMQQSYYYQPIPIPNFQNYFSNFWQVLLGEKSPMRKVSQAEPNRLGDSRSDFSYVPNPNKEKIIFDPSPQEYAATNYTETDDQDDVTVEKMMANAAMKVKNEGIISNTVESYVANGESPQIEFNESREMLNMTSITEDMSFNIGENVLAWRTLQRNTRESHALIGVTNTSIVLVQEKHGVYALKSEELLLSRPTFFITYTFWNQTQRSIDGIVIVSIQYEIVFYRINEAMDKMQFIWMWPLSKRARYIHHFVIDDADTLLIITDAHRGNGSAANLYRFDMNQNEFYLRQSLSLESPARNMALIQTGHETFMCFPQKNHVSIYRYAKERFQYFTTIESDHADILTAFEMGGYSYLAVGGTRPKIVRYHHGKFVDQTILAKSWGLVEFFLPVPARTYRDDMILFVQHRMDFGSHTHSFVEALIWNGHAFDSALAVPCYIGKATSSLGLGCIVDPDRKWGIIGATTFRRNQTISILVPRHQAPSGLFDLQIDLLPAEINVNDHLLELLSEVIILLDTRTEVLKMANDLIEKFPKDPVDVINVKDQHFDVVYTHDLDLGTTIPSDGIFLDDERITEEQVEEFYTLLNEADELLKQLEQLNRTKRDVNHIQSLYLDSVNVTELNARFINDIPTENLIFVENGTVTYDGTLIVTQSIQANSVERRRDDEDMIVGQAEQGTTVIRGDLNFEEINGIKWKDLINQIVLKHLPVYLDEITVNGVSFFFFAFLF